MPSKKKKVEAPKPRPSKLVLLMLEAIRLEIRASAEDVGGVPLRNESDAISARVLSDAR